MNEVERRTLAKFAGFGEASIELHRSYCSQSNQSWLGPHSLARSPLKNGPIRSLLTGRAGEIAKSARMGRARGFGPDTFTGPPDLLALFSQHLRSRLVFRH